MTTTTSTALRTGSAQVGFVLAIEGYANLITDAADLTAVETAWAGTYWSNAISGLRIKGTIRQQIEPWATEVNVPSLQFTIQPDDDDTFGVDAWKTKPSFQTRLDDLFEGATDGSGTITVKSVPSVSSGTLYMGSKAVSYSATPSGTTITVPLGGAMTFTPFEAYGGQKYSRPHTPPAGVDWDVAAQPKVQDVPPTWLGRRVALYIHRIVNGVWDVRAQAQLEFAGKILAISEDSDGNTVLDCEELRADIRDAVLLKGQWEGYCRVGVRLQTGDALYVEEFKMNISTGSSTHVSSDPLTVVASGASGTDELNAGYYELGDFMALLNRWLANDPNLNETWSVTLKTVAQGGRRASFDVVWGGTATHFIKVHSTSREILTFLGFSKDQEPVDDPYPWRLVSDLDFGTSSSVTSSDPPYRIKPFPSWSTVGWTEQTVELDRAAGHWVTHADMLPAPFNSYIGGGEDWSFFRLKDALYFGRLSDPVTIDRIIMPAGFASTTHPRPDEFDTSIGLTVDDEGDSLAIQQVVVMQDSFASLVTKILASVDGRGVNHPDYDVFPDAMGCPGLPWDLLGDPFLDSVKQLEQAMKTEAMMIVLERPTKLVDVLIPEMLLRFAWLVFKDGGYIFTSPPTPNSLTADHTLDETNKAMVGNDYPSLVSRTQVTKDYLRNVIAVHYNRTVDDKYRDNIIVRDETSISEYGEARQVSIDAPNSYSDIAGTGHAVEDMAASLVARVLPAFGRALKTVTRTIAPSLYHMAPGDTVSLSDDRIRDPVTGTRGLSARAGVVLSTAHSYGHEGGNLFGECTILISDEDRTYPLSPAAEIDTTYSATVDGITFTNGYAATAAGGPAIKLKTHAYSKATDSVDASRFANSDKVRIYEIDPADPASITAWDRTLAASGAVSTTNSYLVLTSDISAPAYSSSLNYRVAPQLYSAVQTSQKLSAYLADDSDDFIQNVAKPNLYAEDVGSSFARASLTAPYRLIANETYSEGRPCDAGLVHDLITDLNSLISYKTAVNQPWLLTTAATTSAAAYQLLACFPFFIGGRPFGSTLRVIKVAAIGKTNNVIYTTSVRVTSSKFAPYGASGASWTGPYQQVTCNIGATTTTESSEHDLTIVPADLPGCTWLTVEYKTSNVAGTATFYGLSRLYLGPVAG